MVNKLDSYHSETLQVQYSKVSQK